MSELPDTSLALTYGPFPWGLFLKLIMNENFRYSVPKTLTNLTKAVILIVDKVFSTFGIPPKHAKIVITDDLNPWQGKQSIFCDVYVVYL